MKKLFSFRDNLIYLIIISLAILHYLSAYPGGVTPDTVHQFYQSKTFHFSDAHPPLFSLYWSGLNLIYSGPEVMLASNIFMLWIAVLIFFETFKNSYPLLARSFILIPFFPSVVLTTSMIWKDASASHFIILAISIITNASLNNKKPNTLVSTIIFILIFLSVGTKFQIKFISPILIFWWIKTYQKNFLHSIAATILMVVVIVYGNIYLAKKISIQNHFEQMRQVFDIAGISINEDKNLFPNAITEKPIFSWGQVKKLYTPCLVNFLINQETKIYDYTSNLKELADINKSLFNLASTYPLSYLKHRAKNFRCILHSKNIGEQYAFILEEDFLKDHPDREVRIISKDIIKKPRFVFLKNVIKSYIKVTGGVIDRNIFSFCLIIFNLALSWYLIKRLLSNEKQQIIKTLLFISIISVSFCVVLFFTTMAADYRYFYLVRLLTAFSLPISAMLVSNLLDKKYSLKKQKYYMLPYKKFILPFALFVIVTLLTITTIKLFNLAKNNRSLTKAVQSLQNPRSKSYVELEGGVGLVVNTLYDFPVLVDSKDGCVSTSLRKYGDWQPEITKVLQRIIKPGDNVLHLGGHVGFFDITLAKLVTPSGKVFTFEPNDNSFKILRKNIILHDAENIVSLYNYGAWSRVEKKKLCFDAINTGGANVRDKGKSCQDIQLETVDNILANKLKRIDVLFMDIEGAEIHAMIGAKNLLSNSPNCIILMEWNPNMMKSLNSDVTEFSKDYFAKGYNIYKIVDIDKYKKLTFEELLSETHCDIIIIPPHIKAESLLGRSL